MLGCQRPDTSTKRTNDGRPSCRKSSPSGADAQRLNAKLNSTSLCAFWPTGVFERNHEEKRSEGVTFQVRGAMGGKNLCNYETPEFYKLSTRERRLSSGVVSSPMAAAPGAESAKSLPRSTPLATESLRIWGGERADAMSAGTVKLPMRNASIMRGLVRPRPGFSGARTLASELDTRLRVSTRTLRRKAEMRTAQTMRRKPERQSPVDTDRAAELCVRRGSLRVCAEDFPLGGIVLEHLRGVKEKAASSESVNEWNGEIERSVFSMYLPPMRSTQLNSTQEREKGEREGEKERHSHSYDGWQTSSLSCFDGA
eukprot:scaffold7388_cov248-Pinguiococcus_pyrenoidosus.AAC.2